MLTLGLRPWLALAFGACVVAIGCGNPADDAAEAFVGEPLPIPGEDLPIVTASDATAPVDGDPGGTSRRYLFASGSETLPPSYLTWLASRVVRSHAGLFSRFQGEIDFPSDRVEDASVRVTIEIRSLGSDSASLVAHLWSADFFDLETYPTSSFVSTSISGSGPEYDITGNLTLHGVTKSITFPATITVTDEQIVATAEFFIRRSDWEINYAGAADDLIRDEVVLRMHIDAVPAEAVPGEDEESEG